MLERAVLVVRCRPQERRLVVAGAAAGERVLDVPANVSTVSCTPDVLRYQPQGSATGMTLVLRDSRGRGRRLTVGAFTGLTRVETAN